MCAVIQKVVSVKTTSLLQELFLTDSVDIETGSNPESSQVSFQPFPGPIYVPDASAK
jgi:hypothetical protein